MSVSHIPETRDVERRIADLPAAQQARLAARNPLSYGQERLWFLDQLNPGAATLNLASALRLEGRLNRPALVAGLDEIVRRHEVLRTTFAAPGGQAMQVVHPPFAVALPLVDLSGLDERRRRAAALRLAAAEARLPFDLRRGPLLRCRLLRAGEREHLFLVTLHHIVADGWSMEVLIRELEALYDGYSRRQPSPLPPLPMQYLDFARWQRQERRAGELAPQLAYWQRQLAGAPPELALPSDRPRPAAASFRGGRVAPPPPGVPAAGLRQLAREAGVTPYTVLVAAFLTLIHRLTGRRDLVVGSPAGDRTREELAPLIGYFLNLLPLRVELAAGGSFAALLRQVAATVTSARDHQDLPFERLVEELKPDRGLQRAPLVQVVFVQLVPPPPLTVRDLRLTPVDTDAGASQFDLTLSVIESGPTVAARCDFAADLFDAATIRRWVGYYETLLAGALADAGRDLASLPLLGAAERQQLCDWAAGPAAPLSARPFHRGVEERAARRPDAVAAVCGDQGLTFAELNRRANRLARRLRELGAGPESVVALAAERSLDMLLGWLGILKAGAAYLPVDPDYPAERIAWMFEDSRATVVLTQTHLLARWPAHGARVLCLDAAALDGASGGGGGDLGGEPPMDGLAYVIYTSGSTGRPNAVQVTHQGVAAFLAALQELLALGEADVWLALTTLSFDIAVLELALPLLAGARLAVATRAAAAEGPALAAAIAASGATVVQATPTTWQMLLDGGWRADPPLRVLCGGEALPPRLAAQLTAAGAPLWNLYGPTETTIWSGAERILPGAPVLIGRPIAGTTFHVLGPDLAAQPIGVAGELYIGGAGVARGYRGRPALTAQRFVPDPWGAAGRLYRTGDLTRWRPDGRLEFLGRVDHQVKLRGFRIEPGEIEAVLAEHPAVRAAAVAVRRTGGGDVHLAAYVVTRQEDGGAAPRPPLVAELRRLVQGRLPAPMVPSAWSFLDALPRTPNGKLDRGALAALEARSEEEREPALPPRTPLEVRVAEIWAAVLGRDGIGAESSFFELGGHSLTAARMMHRLRAELAVDLPLATLFAAPTVADLAAAVARRRVALAGGAGLGARDQPPPLVPDLAHRHDPFPLNDVQQAYWIGRGAAFALGNVASHSYTEIEMADLDVGRLTAAVRRVIDRHDMLRAVLRPDGMQQILPAVPPYEIAVADLRQAPPPAAAAALAAWRESLSHQVRPTDVWPLFEVRASLLAGRARVHFSLDYLIADAWSMGIIFREVFALYHDPHLELPPLTLSFRDWVLAEKQLEAGAAYRQAEAYWRGRLASLPPAPQLPLAKQPAAVTRPRFVRRSVTLPAAAWQAMQAAGARAGITPSAILLGAFAEVLAVWSKSPRFTINVTLFNRPPVHPEIDHLVGDFTTLNLLAVDTALAGSFELRTRAIQEQLWQDMEHQAMGAVRVLRELAGLGRAADTVMPVVFTSALQDRRRATGAGDDEGRAVYGVSQTPQVWLDHQAIERDGALVCTWDAVEELFPPGLLDDAFAALSQRLAELAAADDFRHLPRLATPAAHRAVQRAANATAGPRADALLHAPFAARAAEQPERPAVIAPDRTLTYGELAQASDRLGARLRRLGAGPGELVAVILEKSWQQVAAVLAVLKSGAAYLPIDPVLPSRRIEHLLEQGRVRLALVPRMAAPPAWAAGLTCLTVEAGTDPLAAAAEAAADALPALPAGRGGDGLAYVIYTSGSTGAPKGVMIDHRGALNTVLDVNQRFAVGAGDRVLSLSALNFDLSVYDLFGVLAAGGALVLPDPARLRDPEHWAELISRHGVTLWNSVPAVLEMLLLGEEPRGDRRLASLRLALLSGDWVPLSQPERLRAQAPGAQFVSLGGATEASIWSILYPVAAVDAAWRSIPYGRPMRNQSFEVLDPALEPRPFWVPGELYIGGLGLSLGYWRDEEKTAAKFIVHPRSGERLYRTGDLGRWLPDGTIEFLGREDLQIKIRGHRIELGEIEAALNQLADVQAAVVSAVGEDRHERRLVAYVVRRSPGAAPAPPAPGVGDRSAALDGAGDRSAAADSAEDRTAALDSAGDPSAAADAADSAPLPAVPLLTDELAKLEWKLAEPGLRRDLDGLPRIDLPAPPADAGRLALFRARRSHRAFLAVPVPLAAFGRSLAALAAGAGSGVAPAAGLDPACSIFCAVRAGRVEGVAAGLYRYDPARHALALVAAGLEISPLAHAAVNRAAAESAAFTLLLAGSAGGAAHAAALLAAGAAGQALMEEAAATGVGYCPIGTLALGAEEHRLGGDRLLHTLLGGAVTADLPRGAAASAAPASGGTAGASTPALLLPGAPPPRPPLAPARVRAPLALPALAALLGSAMQVKLPELPLPKYRYASAGSLYPLQLYLAVGPRAVEGLAAGVYYHHPKSNALSRLADDEAAAAAELPGADPHGLSLLLVARLRAILPVYGELARDFCWIEAGYLNRLLAAAAAGIGLAVDPLPLRGSPALGTLLRWDDGDRLVCAVRLQPPPAAPVAAAAPAWSLGGVADQYAAIAQALGALEQETAPPEAETPAASLRAALAEVLPDYMIPAQFVFLDALPLNANGKVERGALPPPDAPAAGGAAAAIALPQSELERALLAIWRDVLGKSSVGVDDSFFAAGGNSLHLVRIRNRIQEEFRCELPLTELFKHPTVALLAAALGESGATSAPPPDSIQSQADRQHEAIRAKQRAARQRSAPHE